MAVPHVLLGQTFVTKVIVAIALLYGMIGKVNGFVEIDQREFLRAESKIGFAIHPDGERLNAGHEEPLANVEFAIVYDEWSF